MREQPEVEWAMLVAKERKKLITAIFIEQDNGEKLLIFEFRKKSGRILMSWAPTWEALREMCRLAIMTEIANGRKDSKDELHKWELFGDEFENLLKLECNFTELKDSGNTQ